MTVTRNTSSFNISVSSKVQNLRNSVWQICSHFIGAVKIFSLTKLFTPTHKKQSFSGCRLKHINLRFKKAILMWYACLATKLRF